MKKSPDWTANELKPSLRPRTDAEAREAAAYIADLAGSLLGLARRHQLSTLAYLLDMTRLEALSLTGSPAGADKDH